MRENSSWFWAKSNFAVHGYHVEQIWLDRQLGCFCQEKLQSGGRKMRQLGFWTLTDNGYLLFDNIADGSMVQTKIGFDRWLGLVPLYLFVFVPLFCRAPDPPQNDVDYSLCPTRSQQCQAGISVLIPVLKVCMSLWVVPGLWVNFRNDYFTNAKNYRIALFLLFDLEISQWSRNKAKGHTSSSFV